MQVEVGEKFIVVRKINDEQFETGIENMSAGDVAFVITLLQNHVLNLINKHYATENKKCEKSKKKT